MMDLLGADLPTEGGAPGQFVWCDGPLLAGLKGLPLALPWEDAEEA